MNKSTKDAVYYVCALIEQIGRTTKNRRADVIGYFSEKDIERQLKLADINHCLPIEQVSGELIEDYRIQEGSFDTVGECRYQVPSVLSIGRVCQRLIVNMAENNPAKAVKDVFSSFISDEISDFNSNVYYANPDYLQKSYEANHLLP
ncbi:MAG: hypothetical protein IJ252_07200 [Solobacterium sp.]|nr:hypothetical protein [Solobacterium sp.]